MTIYRGFDQKFVISAYTQESEDGAAAYDTNLDNTTADNATSMSGFTVGIGKTDIPFNDKEDITGTEHGTNQVIMGKGNSITYSETKAKPHTVAILGILAFGDWTTTGAAGTGFTHKITPIAHASNLPSVQADHYIAGVRTEYNGLKCNSFTLAGNEGEAISVESELIGSGTRTIQASTTYPDDVTESWLFTHHANVYLENGASIAIQADPHLQGSRVITAGTPDDISIYLKSFQFNWNNTLSARYGFGSETIQQNEHIKREGTLTLELQFRNDGELAFFTNQTALAFELDLQGALIVAEQTLRYGVKLVIPHIKLNASPEPQGAVGEFVTCTFDGAIYTPVEDGKEVVYLTVYNAVEEYLQILS
jgi:hypothetical protein